MNQTHLKSLHATLSWHLLLFASCAPFTATEPLPLYMCKQGWYKVTTIYLLRMYALTFTCRKPSSDTYNRTTKYAHGGKFLPSLACTEVSVVLDIGTNLSDNSVTTSTLDEKCSKIAKALAAGSLSSLAEYVVQHKQLSEMVLNLLLKVIDSECISCKCRHAVLCIKKTRSLLTVPSMQPNVNPYLSKQYTKV